MNDILVQSSFVLQWSKRRTGSSSSTATTRSHASFASQRNSYHTPNPNRPKLSKPSDAILLCNIDENNETELLLKSKSEKQITHVDEGVIAKSSSRVSFEKPDSNGINNNTPHETYLNVPSIRKPTNIPTVSSDTSDNVLKGETIAPIATVDTMNDLETECKLNKL